MTLPKFYEFFKPILDVSSKGDILTNKDIRERIIEASNLSEEDLDETLSSGQKRFNNRVYWAKTYLCNAGLMERTSRNHYKITDEGLKLLNSNIPITVSYLYDNYEGFRKFMNKESSEEQGDVLKSDFDEGTPEEMLDTAINEIESKLINDLLTEVMGQDDKFFEGLVVDLLKHIYGGDFEDNSEVTGKSGDGGIDGVVKQDRLGFNSIYIQAKRWAAGRNVDISDVRAFAGALQEKGAANGAFITTSSFSKPAQEYAKNLKGSTRIALIDGQSLAKLMIEYDVGVSVDRNISIKRIDSDYFHSFDI